MYYDPRRNEYIVPSTNTIEGFSESEEEEGVEMEGGSIINYGSEKNIFTMVEDPAPYPEGMSIFPGYLDHVDPEHESFTNGSGVSSEGGGSDTPPFVGAQQPVVPRENTYSTPINSCYDGSTYNSTVSQGPASSNVDNYKKVCNSDVACKGFTIIKDYPQKDSHTVQYKNRIDDGGFPKTPDPSSSCQTYVASTPGLSSVSQLQHNILSVANPALPIQQGSSLDFKDLSDWSGPSTIETSASKVNENWPGGNSKGEWSWDADTLPKDTNYYMVDGSARDQQVISLPRECNGSGLNPERADIIKDPNNPSNMYVYVDGRKMAVKQDTGPGGDSICYTAASWANPSVRSVCEKGGTNSMKNYDSNQANECTKASDISKIPSKTVSGKCFDAIPTIQGSGPNQVGSLSSVNCKSDVRPSDRVRIVNQVSKEANLWSNRGRKNAMLYNAKTEVAASKYDTIQKSNSLLRKQVGSSQSHGSTLDNLNSSIYSQQRQVEVSNDQTRRRNENLFLLKLLLTYCLVVSLPLMLKKVFGGKFKNSYVLLIIVFITIPFIYILGNNLYAIRNRSPMRWPLRNWATGPLPADDNLYEEDIPPPLCPPHENDVAAAEEEALGIQEEIDDLQQKIKQCEAKEENWKKTINKDQTLLCKINKNIPGKSCENNNSVGFSF